MSHLIEHPGGHWCTLCGMVIPMPGHAKDCPTLQVPELEEVQKIEQVPFPLVEENREEKPADNEPDKE